MNRFLVIATTLLLMAGTGECQFSSKWLQREEYWGDGKAEFNIYEAQEVRYGQARPSEVLHIFVREPFAPKELVKTENGAQSGAYSVLKLNQILHIPTGIYAYQQMHSAYWRSSNGALIKATLTSNDSCGNTYKELRALAGWRSWFDFGWRYEWRTYWEGMSAGEETVSAPKEAVFYDELPMRVRTIDFSKKEREFSLQLLPSIIGSKKGEMSFHPARISWERRSENVPPPGAEEIFVQVRRGELRDEFSLEPEFPHRLRLWVKADGSVLRLKRSIKIDYWNYNKIGDKERGLGLSAPALP